MVVVGYIGVCNSLEKFYTTSIILKDNETINKQFIHKIFNNLADCDFPAKYKAIIRFSNADIIGTLNCFLDEISNSLGLRPKTILCKEAFAFVFLVSFYTLIKTAV